MYLIITLIGAAYFTINTSFGLESLSLQIILILIVSIIAFLCFNFPPATIFMGDSGSLSLGFLIASFVAPSTLNDYFLPINTNTYPLYIGALISISIAIVPVFDTAFVTITRLLDSRKISQGGRDHTSHRLAGLGLHERKVITFFYFLSLTGLIISILITKYPTLWLPLVTFLLLIISMLGVYIGRIQVNFKSKNIRNFYPVNGEFALILLDIGLITLCFNAAFYLRFGITISGSSYDFLNSILPIIIGSGIVSFLFFGVYKRKWINLKYQDIWVFSKASFGAVILSLAMVTLFLKFPDGNSRSVYLIFFFLLMPTTFVSRFTFSFLDKILKK